MTTRLADDLRQAVEEQGGAPVFVVDAVTGRRYVLMRAEQFEKITTTAERDDVEAMYPLLADFQPEDWEDISHYDAKS